MKVKVKRIRMSVLEFERTFAGRGVFVYALDEQGIHGKETVGCSAKFETVFVQTVPNTIYFPDGDWEDSWLSFYQVKYVDVVEFAGSSTAYITIVCNGFDGDVKHRIKFVKNR